MSHQLETDRLILRNWKASDYEPFYALNSDLEAMRYFPSPYTRAQSDHLADKCQSLIQQRGWGLWAVSEREDEAFIGFVGLHTPNANMPCSPCVEIGWRLLPQYWGNGFATEGAHKALEFAFKELALPEVVSFTAKTNQPSRAVMQRIGMHNSLHNFMHPDIYPDNPLAEHVLYQLTRNAWFEQIS
ncbi:Putative ribosomal N-acetyltransferase YdaF [Paraglaciecola mesophila]|uniref:Ribosomal N-acetyltransferase YdaF n=1 Tax=Paraglaciecola mesophila TaxID=197222 RepID=A0A857JPK2_9ALTE|nr:GNAT family N-acetyltransferase [Paraglaciecola mesophila]QHJ12474.1 Putative ribosomal N-acetyltransferase YdaF [Paraglaciecola mesophila]